VILQTNSPNKYESRGRRLAFTQTQPSSGSVTRVTALSRLCGNPEMLIVNHLDALGILNGLLPCRNGCALGFVGNWFDATPDLSPLGGGRLGVVIVRVLFSSPQLAVKDNRGAALVLCRKCERRRNMRQVTLTP
jgi:hypothetical protein